MFSNTLHFSNPMLSLDGLVWDLSLLATCLQLGIDSDGVRYQRANVVVMMHGTTKDTMGL